MNTAQVFREMDALSKEERINFAMDVWQHAVESGAYPDITDEQRAELDRRLDDLEAHPDDDVSWEEVKRSLKHRT